MSYWWVSQGSYYTNEMSGGYLWVPQRHNSGKRIHHWERIKELKTGGIVFSHVRQSIVAVSEVIQEFYEANRPIPMPEKDVATEGFRVDLKYHPLDKTLKLREIIDELQKILKNQTRYKPLNKNGVCNQGYLFPLIEEAGDFILTKTSML
jgi:hypothetical protein